MTETFTFSDRRNHSGCPFPGCKKPSLCRPHLALLPESLLESMDYQRIYRYFQTRLQLHDLITAEPPQLSSAAESAAAPAPTSGQGSEERTGMLSGPAAPLPRLVCCVCKVVLRDGPEPVSHGYCAQHFDEAMAKVEAS